MDIHVVQPGDTITTVAEQYGVSVERLILNNSLINPDQLIIGESIVIAYPSQTYTVREGDNLEAIANTNNITVNELLRNNPYLVDREFIYPGEELVISYNRTAKVTTHGFATSFVNNITLRKTLPYLSYLTLLNYNISRNGEVIAIADDTELLQLTKAYGAIPLMLLTTLSIRGDVDLVLLNEVLVNEDLQNRLFDQVLNIIREKGYFGVNISAQYITSRNQELFYNYTKNLSDRLRQEGFITMITINPRIERVDNEVIYENIDYTNIVNVVDSVLFLQYKWAIEFGPPAPVLSVYNTNIFLDNVVPQIGSEKIDVSIPTLGYDWELPYTPEYSRANALSILSVKRLAQNVGAVINFDNISQTAYFQYNNIVTGSLHEVWYVNAITVNSMITMLLEKGINGTGVWNIMAYFTELWLVINSQYEIIKLLPEI